MMMQLMNFAKTFCRRKWFSTSTNKLRGRHTHTHTLTQHFLSGAQRLRDRDSRFDFCECPHGVSRIIPFSSIPFSVQLRIGNYPISMQQPKIALSHISLEHLLYHTYILQFFYSFSLIYILYDEEPALFNLAFMCIFIFIDSSIQFI